jgi:outer membrane receptor protein involved in Fe transport
MGSYESLFPISLVAPSATFAMVADAADPPDRPSRETMQTVTVLGDRQLASSAVGSRLGLTLRDTPASVTVIPREFLLQRGDQSTAQALDRAPGFAPVGMTAFAGSALAARGFSGNNSVAQLYDGNRLFVSGGAMSFPVDTWPFERIEVLAGPASVLYGAGSIGGAVNYVPRDIPLDQRRQEAFLGLGSWDTRRIGHASAGPVTDVVGYRANAVFNATEGYVERNDNERWAVSTALRLALRPDLTLILMYDGAQIDDTGYFGTPLIDGAIDPRTRRLNYNVSDAGTTFRNDWARARLEWRPGDALSLTQQGDHRSAAEAGGFSLHAGIDIEPHQRTKLERLCRYVSRPPVAEDRLTLTASGQESRRSSRRFWRSWRRRRRIGIRQNCRWVRGPAQLPAHPGNGPDSGRLRQSGSLHEGDCTNQDGATGCFELPIRRGSRRAAAARFS